MSFAAGDLTKTISVTINGDTTVEPDETFFVNLLSATNGGTIVKSQGLGTITNDDTAGGMKSLNSTKSSEPTPARISSAPRGVIRSMALAATIGSTARAAMTYSMAGPETSLLDGGTGADIMYGGAGDDVYRVDNIGDVVSEQTAPASTTAATIRCRARSPTRCLNSSSS